MWLLSTALKAWQLPDQAWCRTPWPAWVWAPGQLQRRRSVCIQEQQPLPGTCTRTTMEQSQVLYVAQAGRTRCRSWAARPACCGRLPRLQTVAGYNLCVQGYRLHHVAYPPPHSCKCSDTAV